MHKISLFLVTFLLIGCLPKRPGKNTITHRQVLKYETELLTVNNTIRWVKGKTREKIPEKNLVIVSLDETVQPQFKDVLFQTFKEEVRIEEVAWWKFSKNLKGLYDKVIKISYKQFHIDSITYALKVAEKLGKNYDLFLLVHGIPNHLTSTKGFPLISYEDIQGLDKIVTKLDFVFQQNCFGNTLIGEWHDLGAQTVMSYDGWNRNFFFVDFFFRNYRKSKDPLKAYDRTVETIYSKMSKSLIYKKILEVIGLSVDEYFQISPDPEVSTLIED